jgi:hypothetical protein
VATAEQALGWVDKLYEVLSSRRAEIEQSFNYFEGRQPLAYATDQWKTFHQDRYRNFSDNWCGVVGRSPVGRLRIDGIRIGDDTDVLSVDEKELWNDWQRNEMGAQSKQGFLASTIAKRSAVLVWGDDDDQPVATWEHPSQVAVSYEASGRRERLAAIKAWVEGDDEYATLYLPDEVWKFERKSLSIVDGRTPNGLYVNNLLSSGGWNQRLVAGETWPLSNPFGEVPIVEWLNRPMLGMEPLSDIAGTIAMQDAINMLWAYLFTAADHASMPARVVLGAEPPKIPILDETGQIIGSKPAKLEDLAQGRLMFLPGAGANSNARIDQWDAAKLDVFTGVISEAVAHIAAQTSTPGHYLLSNEKFANLNGDALTAAEVPLVTKAEDSQVFYDPSARDVFRLMAKVRGNDGLAESVRTASIQWKDAAMHSLAQVADAATKDRSIGLSLETILRTRYGMTPSQIKAELARIRDEQRIDPFQLLDPATQAAIKGVGSGDTKPPAGA